MDQRRPAGISDQPGLERALDRARAALFWERVWPRLVPILSLLALFVALSWLGIWRIAGDWARLTSLVLFGLALLVLAARFRNVRLPHRPEAMARVETTSGLPHHPILGLDDALSPVADDPAAQALWHAHRRRLAASLGSLKAGAPRPDIARRDPNALRFAAPVLLVIAFAVGWGEWGVRLREAFLPVSATAAQVASARIDAWIDPPPYTGRPPVFLSRVAAEPAQGPVTVPEGSRLTVRVVSPEPPVVTVGGATLQPSSETGAEAEADESIRTYDATLDRNAVASIEHGTLRLEYPISVIEDRPPTVTRGPVTVNRTGSFTLAFDVNDDYGVTDGRVTFPPKEPLPEGARPLVETPEIPLRIERGQGGAGTARADGRLESHPFAGLDVVAETVVRDAAGQEGRPPDAGDMTLPARPFSHPVARALVEQRRLLALDANRQHQVALALDALTIAPERFLRDEQIYLGLRVAYHRLVDARNDDQLRDVLDYLWDMARAIEDGDMSAAEERLQAAREALEDALENGASEQEIAELMQELREAMREFLESYAAEMAERDLQNMPQMPMDNMQMLTERDLDQMLDRIEDLARLGDSDAAQQLLSELQQMLDNLEMAQQGQMQQQDGDQMMQQLDELARIMREQQRLMDETFQLDQGRRPGEQGQEGQQRDQGEGDGEPLSPSELAELMRQMQEGQGQLQESLEELLQQLQQGQQPGQGEGEQGEQGQQGQGGEGERALGRAGRAMGQAERSLGRGESGLAYGQQGEALEALREGMQGMMNEMFAQQQPGQGQPQQAGRGQPRGQTDPLGRPQRNEGTDLGQNVRVPEEIDVERARQILNAIRERLGERYRPSFELDYLERLLGLD